MNWPAIVEYLQICPPAKTREQILHFAMGKCKVKRVRPKIRLPRGKAPISMKALKKAAWDAFSKWIRLRDANEWGICKCCTCDRPLRWQDMQAGHFRSRIYENVLFDEQNVHAQCPGCNMPPNYGKPYEYALFLERKYGEGTPNKILERAKHRAMKRDELEMILEKYKTIIE